MDGPAVVVWRHQQVLGKVRWDLPIAVGMSVVVESKGEAGASPLSALACLVSRKRAMANFG